MRRPALAIALTGLLAGCAAVTALTDVATPLEVYDLDPPREVPQAARRTGLHLIVEMPTTSGAIETDSILVRPTPLQAQYLPDARWSAPAPDLAQTLLLRTLERTGGFEFVGRRPLGSSGDFALVSELDDFAAAVTGPESATVRVGLTARLVREQDATIVASRRFEGAAVSPGLGDMALVAAYDAAADIVLADLAAWTLDALGVPGS